jgi:hypothetical protein
LFEEFTFLIVFDVNIPVLLTTVRDASTIGTVNEREIGAMAQATHTGKDELI